MPEERKELDLEERRRLLEERRRMLEKRRQELARRQKPGEEEKREPKVPPRPPEAKPKPPSPPTSPRKEPEPKPKEAPPTPPRKPAPPPPAPPPPKKTPPPPKPAPPAKKPAEPPKKEPEHVRKPVPAKADVGRPGAPKRGLPLPLLIGAALVIAVIIIVIVVTSGGKKQSEERALEQQARVESLQTVQAEAALQESLDAVHREELNSLLVDLQQKIDDADQLQAADRAGDEYNQAQSAYEGANESLQEEEFEAGIRLASQGLVDIDQAIVKSRRIADREAAARASREEAVANLQSTVSALRDSLSALSDDGANDYARSQYQQLTQIVDKAGQLANDGQIESGQEQVDWAFEMTNTVREAIVDGKRQEAEALQLLQQMKEAARQESAQQVREESLQQAAVMTPAKVEKWVSPVYPRMAQQAGIEGRVVVEFEVGTDGKARDFVIIESLPAGCDDAAIEAIKRMEFTAATQGGRPVPTRIKMPFMFKKS